MAIMMVSSSSASMYSTIPFDTRSFHRNRSESGLSSDFSRPAFNASTWPLVSINSPYRSDSGSLSTINKGRQTRPASVYNRNSFSRISLTTETSAEISSYINESWEIPFVSNFVPWKQDVPDPDEHQAI